MLKVRTAISFAISSHRAGYSQAAHHCTRPGPVLALEKVAIDLSPGGSERGRAAQAIIVSNDTDIAAKEVLAGLRAALDPDPERAGQKHVLLRRKLVSFFEWGGAASPDAFADETLMTAAWRMTDGEPVQNVSGGCAAIARSILHKHAQEHDEQPGSPDDTPRPAEPDPCDDMEGLLHSFDTGLDALPADSRDLILTYYAGEHPQAIEARRTLAQRLNLPLNQLRIRAHRTRSELEQAVMGLTAQSSSVPK
jgi:DNA-directed RNA polymerase specialized sigma24 family protein